MPKTTTKIESFVSPEDFRAVILDVEKYPEFLEEVKRVKVHERSATTMKATFWVEVAFAGMEVKTEYTVRYAITDDEVRWELDSSPSLTRNEGSWKLAPGADGDGTIAHYENELITNLPIPPEIQALFAQEELPKMMEHFRDRAEEL